MTVCRFSQSSDVSVAVEDVLATITLSGVNAELWPLVQMTAPSQWANTPLAQWPEKQELFKSWILLFGVLPIDRHAFCLQSVMPGRGFVETSSSTVNAQWNHTRTVTPIAGGCRVTDTVAYQSRVSLLGYLLRPTYQLVFWWRHRRIRAKFGGRASA
jgi:ligand-binding SRPBCC domain-containing protein